jgi:hypothetical protein
MSIENQPTQRLRRPSEPPMPAPLDPTRPQEAVPAGTPDDGSTDVLSLDNLFERQTAAAAPEVTTTPAATPATSVQPAGPVEPSPPASVERRVAERRVADRRVGNRRADATPAAAAPVSRQSAPAHRLRHDTNTALRSGVTRTGRWFTTGDNALIVVTALVALALVLVIGLV